MSSKLRLKAVAAMASNRVIGKEGALPWRLPEDLKWFKKITLGNPVLMGRKTWESLPKALPGRRNIVLSRGLSPADAPGADIIRTPEGLDMLGLSGDVSIIGGAEIYRLFLPRCGELYLSYVFEPYEGDARLPEFEKMFGPPEVLACYEAFELRLYRRISR